MLTRLIVRNFKRFKEVDIELGSPVVFIGPNNSGKTTALQALALWQVGVTRWMEKRRGEKTPEKRPGVVIGRRDLIAVPVPDAKLLWRKLHVRDVRRSGKSLETKNIRIDIVVEGLTDNEPWACGLEFDYNNEESFYCRPLMKDEAKNTARMAVPDHAGKIRVAFLPPMSGLVANETKFDLGAINVRVGEGRTAEVLRNLCYSIFRENHAGWTTLCDHVKRLFGTEIDDPRYVEERGEISMSYIEYGDRLDLSSSGRGLQQTLLLLAYMYANPGSVLLLDEPDAHLEILRQRQIYQLLTDVARENGNQIIAASHSEIILNEAAGRDVVVAFVGKPHRINDRGSQVMKSLRDIGFEDYYLAEDTGWVLYLEGSTDLAFLREFARALEHEDAEGVLERPFVKYVGNLPPEVARHFHGIREAVPHVKGVALFDRLDRDLPQDLGAVGLTWHRKEIENYVCNQETLEAYAEDGVDAEKAGPLFAAGERQNRIKTMRKAIEEIGQALGKLGKGSPWSRDTKASSDFLTPLFGLYFSELGLPNLMAKKNFHELARFVPKSKIDPEIREKLDEIVKVANSVLRAKRED